MSNSRTGREYGSIWKHDLPDPNERPVLSKFRAFLLNFTHFGLSFMVILLSVIVVPAQVERMVPARLKGRTMGGLIAGGAGLTVIVSPLVGMVSDRFLCRVGRRRPLMLSATAVLCVGLLGMAMSAPEISRHGNAMDKVGSSVLEADRNFSADNVVVPVYGNKFHEYHCYVDLEAQRCEHYESNTDEKTAHVAASYEVGNVAAPVQGIVMPRFTNHKSEAQKPVGNLGLFVTFYLVTVVAQSTITIPCIALLSDKTHPSQRGINSGIMGFIILFGNITGALAGIGFTHCGVLVMYSIIISVVVLCVLVTTFSTKEERRNRNVKISPLGCKTLFFGFIEPLKDPDFRWVFITRFFMQQGVSTVTGFLEYWLNDVIQLPYCWSAATSVSLLLLPLLFAASMSSLFFGIISDKARRRKIIVSLAALVMGLGSFINAFISGMYAFFIVSFISFIIGLGLGAYLSVDLALVMDVMLVEAEMARDIAIWHQSLVLPQAIAAPLGGAILDGFERINCQMALGYVVLFIVASVYFLLSAIFVFKIKRVR